MKTATETLSNGNVIKYQITDAGTAYHTETPAEVVRVLESARSGRTRVKIFYGDVKTGRDWCEEHDTTGRIGRSTGSIKIPLIIHNERSMGGPGILDHCIIKIRETKTGRVLYQAANYKAPKIEIVPAGEQEQILNFTHSLIINGKLYSNHKSEKSAQLLKNKLL